MCTGPVVLQLTKAELKGEKKTKHLNKTKNITGKIETKLN